jgi:lipid II:glycine glycyltransferase (peptidoglycan interpeptide bridge formation enzyme)
MAVNDLEIWNEFVVQHKPVQFLQSFEWAEFQQILARKIFRLKGGWGQSLVVKYQLPLGKSYFYSPRGPLLSNWDKEIIAEFQKQIKELAIREKVIFFRFELPTLLKFWSEGEQNFLTKWSIPTSEAMSGLSLRRIADVQPSKTIILDLSKSETEIISAMHPKTRYNIRLAERRGIKIREGKPEEIEIFLNLLSKTAKRDNFRSHPDNYYRQLVKTGSNFIKLFLAEHHGSAPLTARNKVLAANLIVFFADTVTYLHGASDDEFKNFMAPHLLQWEVIRQAKHNGYRFYDFWGIDEKKWPGVTRFKMGFVNADDPERSRRSGQVIEYPGTFDLVFDKFWYQLYNLGKKLPI